MSVWSVFECVPDFDIAQALLGCLPIAGQQGMIVARGPIDLSTHNNCLFLVDGFDSPPLVMTAYNALLPRVYGGMAGSQGCLRL